MRSRSKCNVHFPFAPARAEPNNAPKPAPTAIPQARGIRLSRVVPAPRTAKPSVNVRIHAQNFMRAMLPPSLGALPSSGILPPLLPSATAPIAARKPKHGERLLGREGAWVPFALAFLACPLVGLWVVGLG